MKQLVSILFKLFRMLYLKDLYLHVSSISTDISLNIQVLYIWSISAPIFKLVDKFFIKYYVYIYQVFFSLQIYSTAIYDTYALLYVESNYIFYYITFEIFNTYFKLYCLKYFIRYFIMYIIKDITHTLWLLFVEKWDYFLPSIFKILCAFIST